MMEEFGGIGCMMCCRLLDEEVDSHVPNLCEKERGRESNCGAFPS